MFGWLQDLTFWVKDFSDSPWSVTLLGANSFTEAIFFPVPPDPLLIAISISKPHLSVWLAALVTITSVTGGYIGYLLGQRFGKPILHRFVSESKILRTERLVSTYGLWAILLAAFTPIPYKVFAITAGVLNLNQRTFIIASLVGRGIRFFALAALVMAYGDSIESFIDSNFEVLTIVTAVALAVLVACIGLMRRRRASTPIG